MEFIMEDMNKEGEAVLASLYGQMERHMRESGDLAKKMVMVYGNLQKETIMRENGNKIYNMARVVTSTKAAQCIEGILKAHSNMGEGSNNFKMGINIKDNTLKESHMDMESMFGQMGILMKENLLMVQGRAKESLKRQLGKFTKDNSKET